MADNLFGGKDSGRTLAGKQKVKTAKRRTAGSTRWLERQLNDP
jgi:23S rRNA (uridine2552-2'-O)-methyltransferase